MPSNVITTKYLQVPKVLPHRKTRSRSRSRSSTRSKSPEVVSPQPVKTRILGPAPPPSPPPMPPKMTEIHMEPPTKCFTINGSYGLKADDRTTSRTKGNTLYDIHDTTHDAANITIFDMSGDLNGDYYTLAKTPSPPPPPPLRQRIVGAWRLEAYIAYPTPSCRIQRPTYPMTKNVTGIIMYTPDGYMSAHMLIPGQNSFKRGEGEEAQWAEAGKRSFAYAGPYYISNEGVGREEILRHTFLVCNLPRWVGDIQVRTWKFEENDNVLVLGSEEPAEIRNELRNPVLKWRRVSNNSEGSPPPPMPQIKVSGPGEP